MKKLCLFILLIGSAIIVKGQTSYLSIINYKVYYGWAHRSPQDWMIIRQFENSGKSYLFLVNPQTLETKIDEASFYEVKPMTYAVARAYFRNTPYIKAIDKAEKQSKNIQDAGIESGHLKSRV